MAMHTQAARKGSIQYPVLGGLALLGLGLSGWAAAQQVAPAPAAEASPWKVDVYYENDTRRRGKDATGQTVGLSKFRNTLQVDASRPLSDGWSFSSILRGTFDGVYRLNSRQYGKDAGGSVNLGSSAVPGGSVPFGGGLNQAAVAGAFGLADNQFGFNATSNPNEGLRVLGDRWHNTAGTQEATLAVPVRPCDVDARGCADFGGYGNASQSKLELPEFNSRADFLREAYVRKTFELDDGKSLFVKLGRQQVVWGRTDLFRVLDVINPVDYSRNNIYDELQDIRIPLWIAQAEYRMGASESMQERNVQVVLNVDKFRASNLGQCGSPNAALDAGCFFRAMKNVWDNGGTVANFASASGTGAGPFLATDFGPNQIGIRNIYLPEWSLKNMPLGLKYEGISMDGLSFSLNALTYRSQLPSLHAFNSGATNPFTGTVGNTVPPAAGVPVSHLIAFDMHFPRINLVGGSMDFTVEPINTAVRLEGAFTNGEEFANTLRPELYSKNKVFRSVIGLDRPTLIPFINPHRTTLLSAQLFYQHIFNHELQAGTYGPVGMPDWKDNVIGTLLIKGFVMNDRVSPQLIMARDFQARAWAIAPSVDWIITNDLKVSVGFNYKGGDNRRYGFDDCRSCNPYPPFTTYAGQAYAPGSAGLGGIEPLGRFRAGVIGTAMNEDEAYLTLRYKF